VPCQDGTRVASGQGWRCAVETRCNSWACETCNPDRVRRLIALALGGEPTKFLTLTVNPRRGQNPTHRRKLLAIAWNHLVKRWRRLHAGKEIAFLVVCERTKLGEPHLHILLRAPWTAQKVISQWMRELAAAPVVWIERIDDERKAARYVAKYVGKEPAQFGKSKRYWTSRNWDLREPDHDRKAAWKGHVWEREPLGLDEITDELRRAGHWDAIRTSRFAVGGPAPMRPYVEEAFWREREREKGRGPPCTTW
jgi:hypothetical protein